jgi:AmmeMemoRadiSam system protein A
VSGTRLNADERGYLLRLARAAVEAEVRGGPAPSDGDAPPSLRRCAGAFVSVHCRGDLRGCVGYVTPQWLLPETVARAAAAVTRDDRFERLRVSELPGLLVEVSVLSSPTGIEPDAIEIGVHGLILSYAGRSGLLLPQVPVEWGWDVTTFLGQLCRKAGLPEGTWRVPGAELLGFTAERLTEHGDPS